MVRSPGAIWLGTVALAVSACGGRALPDARATAAEFSAAAARGDAAAVHRLLTSDARRALGEAGTRARLAEAREEIAASAGAFATGAAAETTTQVTFLDGEVATVSIEGGRYRVGSAAGLPSLPRTPAQALADLRAALARRSYAALLRVLAAETRGSLEAELGSLVEGLEHPEQLRVEVHGETAEVQLAGGHKVVLTREAGVWRVRDFL